MFERLSDDQLLHAWIDGELPAELEQQFYTRLGSDAVYRGRLRQYQYIRAQTLHPEGFPPPPVEVSESLFQRLAFDHTAKTRNNKSTRHFFPSLWSHLAVAAIASFVSILIAIGLQRQASVEQNDTPILPRSISARTLHSVSLTSVPSEPAMSSSEEVQPIDNVSRERPELRFEAVTVNDNILNRLKRRKTVANTFHRDRESNADITVPSGAEQLSAVQLSTHNENLVFPIDRNNGDHSACITDDRQTAILTSYAALSSDYNTDEYPNDVQNSNEMNLLSVQHELPVLDMGFLTVEIRGLVAKSFPDVVTSTRQPESLMENTAIAVYYNGKLTDLGLEYGQEVFSQYVSSAESSTAPLLMQNKSTSWMSATLRRRSGQIAALAGIEAYASISAGATFERFPLMKSTLGLMFIPDSRIRFHVGLEGTILAYPRQHSWFTSKRAGVTYGLSILF